MAAQRTKRRQPVAKLKTGEAVTELGSTGLKHFAGNIDDDFLQDLRSQTKRVKLFREMRDNSPVIGGAFLAIEQLLRQVEIHVEAASEDAEDQRAAEFVQSCLDDMDQPWGVTLTQALTMLEHGWSLLEVVYKRRGGDVNDPRRQSKFTDGMLGWRKFEIRCQESLDRWEFEGSDVVAMWQRPAPTYALIRIPMDKAILCRTTDSKGSPEGRSLLRNCVMPWKFVKRIQEIEGIGIERDLAGLPVAWVPTGVLASDATGDALAAQSAMKELVTNIRRDEQEGVMMPLQYDANGNKLYDLTLLTTGGSRQFDTSAIIQRYETRIAQAMLADFIMLGHEKVGSFSLSSDKTDLFAVAIKSYLDDGILEPFNRKAIPTLLRLNGMRGSARMCAGDIEKPQLDALGKYLTALAGAGVPLPVDDETFQGYLFGAANLPRSVASDTAEVGKGAEWIEAIKKARES